jgi:hypothetical protein
MTFSAPALPHMSTVKYDAWAGERIRMLANRARSHGKAGELAFFGDAAQLTRSTPSVPPPAVAALPEVESSFWKSIPLEQLVADQGFPPIMDLRELDAIWSEDDVFDDALSELLEERAKRRHEVRTS